MRRWPRARFDAGLVIVPTYCLYPSNACVNVFVEGGEATFTVNDGGGALDDVQAAGVKVDPMRAGRPLSDLVRPQGLAVSDGVIYAYTVPGEALQAAIVLVANASKEAAHYLLDHFKAPLRRSFRADLARLLETSFPGRFRKDYKLVGASNKQHTFDYIIEAGKHKKS